MKAFCVQHREGWCAVAEGAGMPGEMADNVETLCGMVIVLPFGMEEREPTCEECKAKLEEQKCHSE